MSKELLASKVVVFEEEPQVRGISSASTSVAGAVGVAEKGPVNKPVLCTSFAAFQEVFGGYTVLPDLALAAKGFFENGGSQLWVVRIASLGSSFAGATLTGTEPIVGVSAIAPGAYWNRVFVEIGPMPDNANVAYFTVSVDGVVVERFENLGLTLTHPRFIEKVVNDPDIGSKLVYVSYSLL
jgi:hypothetical protein